MTDNGNGTYTITNSVTGEKKVVAYGDLQNYGLQPPEMATQKVGDTLRSAELGEIPETLGAGYESVRALRSLLGDKNAYVNQQTGKIEQDPYMSKQTLSQYQNPLTGAWEGMKDIGGAESYALGGGDTLPAKLGIGGVSGFLQGITSDNATPQGIAASTLTGMGANVLPGKTGDVLSAVLGRSSLGKGGEKVPELAKETGGWLHGSPEKIGDTLFNYTKPIEDKLQNILRQDSVKGASIRPEEVNQKIDEIAQTAGPKEVGAAQEYAKTLKQDLKTHIQGALQKTGVEASKAMNIANDEKQPVALDVMNDFKRRVGRDVGNKWSNVQQGKYVPIEDKMAGGVYGFLKDETANRSSAPELVRKYNKLEGAAKSISTNMSKKATGQGGKDIAGLLQAAGIPIGLVTSLATGNPAGVLGALGSGAILAGHEAISHPQTALPLAHAAQAGGNLGDQILTRILPRGIGSLVSGLTQ